MSERARYFIVRGNVGQGWRSFPGGYGGIPENGYFRQWRAARRAARRIATMRGERVHIAIWKGDIRIGAHHFEPAHIILRLCRADASAALNAPQGGTQEWSTGRERSRNV